MKHIDGIIDVCTLGYRATYREIYSKEYTDRIIRDFYNYDRILKEVTIVNKNWGGYFVAIEDDNVIGAGAGGMLDEKTQNYLSCISNLIEEVKELALRYYMLYLSSKRIQGQ
ncbi:hypothetical protein HPL003_01220 [Paenibacillus terrae HPL-003]|uniref:Uncharacterized protein n=1 Tax=Paenibacillus terrae (strain HPL-003) TaxID=985665 RepID=G7VVJ4_PAETH|nr:hypothetical protein HPL003_01220 [Paenibacillus terrae HPL-003]